MGMFDSVFVRCPECRGVTEIQSKAGACMLNDYSLANAPLNVLGDIDGAELNCDCGYEVKVVAMANIVQKTLRDDDSGYKFGGAYYSLGDQPDYDYD